ncbi:unnamed protein product [Rotaria socialis]|uniref:Calpain catalytic domain-containing protein n=1 Tax=Rotaria socialis TaxID=392032 RepID=A0A821CHW0_9BILA|nr:unnamed protein product [Rotaria socialis]CAF3460737.1 unnamed protein product [Rotaria socialis]CAF4610120.1 unnamed protein product [Rotaria socialis]CAF4804104.1 unnamed protein product [Rotaria socialis]
MSTNVWSLDREPYHGDIVQGGLGNCFLIASLQALASCQPQLLKSIISVSPLACFFYRQGQRIEIPVAIELLKDEIQYCRSTVPDVQWPYIIEQAYSEFYGGRYDNLIGGNTSEALYDLIGKPVEEFDPNDRDLWEKIEKGLAEKNALITCGSVVTNSAAAAAATTTAKLSSGLVVNHAYSILATFVYQQTREKYVLIHNPHGINHVLKENSRARNAFFSLASKSHPLWSTTSGTQLMSWNELKRSCNRIQICHINVESRQFLTGNWSPMTSGGCSNFSTFYRNPFFIFPLSHSKKTVLVLGHTVDQRHERTETNVKLNYEQLGITIVELKSHTIPVHDNYEVICQSKFWNKREVTMTIDFQAKQGKQYAAVLSTYYPNINASFWLQVFSAPQFPTLQLRTWTDLFQQTVQTIHGEWHRENSGGRRNKSVALKFYKNPAYLLTLSNASTVRFILRQLFEKVIPLAQHHPIGIYIISTTNTKDEEPTFIRARSVSRLIHLNSGEEYFIIPACFEPNSFGKFELDVLCDEPFTLDPTERELPTPPPVDDKTPTPLPVENKVSTRTSSPRRIVSPARNSATTARTATTRKSITKRNEAPKKRNPSLATARLTNLVDEYLNIE